LKITHEYSSDLGNIKIPILLRKAIDDYCTNSDKTKSQLVRQALANFFGVDISTYIVSAKYSWKVVEPKNDGNGKE
jgi:hypothetical protein